MSSFDSTGLGLALSIADDTDLAFYDKQDTPSLPWADDTDLAAWDGFVARRGSRVMAQSDMRPTTCTVTESFSRLIAPAKLRPLPRAWLYLPVPRAMLMVPLNVATAPDGW